MLPQRKLSIPLAFALALALGACGGGEEDRPVEPSRPATAIPAQRLPEPAAPEPASAPFSFSIHPSLDVEGALHRGEPLLLQALLILEQEEATTLALASGEAWTEAITVTMLDSAGQAVPLEWTNLGGAPATSLSFSREAAEISAVLGLAPEVLATLPPGDYRLDAVFSTVKTAAPGAWEGTVRAPGVVLRLGADRRADSATGQNYRSRLLARWHLLNDHPEEALRQLDAALQNSPDDIALLTDKSEVLLEMNHRKEASAALQQAVSLYYRHTPDPGHPPRWLLRRLRELDADSLAATETAADTPPTPLAVPPVATAQAADASPASTARSAPSDEQAAAAVAKPEVAVEQALEQTASGPRAWLGDQAVAPDVDGQWAVSARAGSEYGPVQNSAARATGAPDVPGADDHPNAWCPAVRDSGNDWLELTFEKAGPATEVRVRQSYGPGAIVKVEAIDPGGEAHLWWEGVDPYGQQGFADDAVWFSVQVPRTDYAVQKIRLTLDLAAHGRWKQIDAVQLIDAAP